MCTFSATYTVTHRGGLSPTRRRMTLTPPTSFLFERLTTLTDGGTMSCAPTLPTCGAAAKVDVSDVEAAFAVPEVQTNLGKTSAPFFGDRGIADAPDTLVEVGDRAFTIGPSCSVASATCTLTPPAVAAAYSILVSLESQQREDPSCAAIPN